jgi:hypothetical protein
MVLAILLVVEGNLLIVARMGEFSQALLNFCYNCERLYSLLEYLAWGNSLGCSWYSSFYWVGNFRSETDFPLHEDDIFRCRIYTRCSTTHYIVCYFIVASYSLHSLIDSIYKYVLIFHIVRFSFPLVLSEMFTPSQY